jgi:DNA-binding MarR family transcriptional regulator
MLSVYDIPFLLHRIVHEMGLAADRTLRREIGISYRRAVTLLVLDDAGPTSQRALAGLLGHSEAAVSTLIRELAADGAVSVESVDKRERRVQVTDDGARLVARARALTEPMFYGVVAAAGLDADELGSQLQRLEAALGAAR